jgi:alpha-beta hydrolase superfamily lysophospholipase
VRLPAEGRVEFGAWLFLPEGSGACPAITMAHGFAGTKEHGIERFAKAFAEAGFVVVVHDHRNFGTSEVRGVVTSILGCLGKDAAQPRSGVRDRRIHAGNSRTRCCNRRRL